LNFRLKNLRYNKNGIEFTVFGIMNRNFKLSTFFFVVLLVFLSFVDCSNVVSEKTYCEKKAEEYFFLCLLNIAISPTYFGKPEWNAEEVQTYSQGYCIAEYNRKKACRDMKTYRPHRKD